MKLPLIGIVTFALDSPLSTIFSSPFISLPLSQACGAGFWCLRSLWYFRTLFVLKFFHTTTIVFKKVQGRKKHSYSVMEWVECRWECKSGGNGTHTQTYYNLLDPFFALKRGREHGESMFGTQQALFWGLFSFHYWLGLTLFERQAMLLPTIYIYIHSLLFPPLNKGDKGAKKGRW